MRSFLLLFAMTLLTACGEFSQQISSHPGLNIIYGKDSREEVTSRNLLLKQAQATAMLVNENKLAMTEQGDYEHAGWTLDERYPLCENERFQEQPLLGFCSGVLIAEDKVLTAAHCLGKDASAFEKTCKTTRLTFGWTSEKAKEPTLPEEDVYACSRIVKVEYNPRKSIDYAIIELDRPVKNAQPLAFADEDAEEDDTVISLSYPLGLPLKKDEGLVVSSDTATTFKAAVDTFAGSSGSPLLNEAGDILGILVRGHDDIHPSELSRLKEKNGCLNFYRCENGFCPGETYLRSSHIEI